MKRRTETPRFPWRVELRKGYQRLNDGRYREIGTDHRLITLVHENVRHRDHQRVLGVVAQEREFVPEDLIHFGQALVEQMGCEWEALGGLRRHSVIFGALQIDPGFYLVLYKYFDGRGTFEARLLPVIPDWINMSLPLGPVISWTVRHPGGNDVQQAQDVGEVKRNYQTYKDAWLVARMKLVLTPMTLDEFRVYIEELLPTVATGRGASISDVHRAEQLTLINNFLYSPSITARETRWAALVAVCEFLEWQRYPKSNNLVAFQEQRMVTSRYNSHRDRLRQQAFRLLTAS